MKVHCCECPKDETGCGHGKENTGQRSDQAGLNEPEIIPRVRAGSKRG